MGVGSKCRNFLAENVGRMAITCLGISASGWLTFIIAFGTQLISLDPIINAVRFLFVPWYVAAVVGPIMYVVIGLDLLLGSYFKFAKFFKSASIFCIIVYIGVLAAPMFFVATLFASAAAGIDEALDAIAIPNLGDVVNLGPFSFIGDALGAVTDFLNGFIRGVLYFILVLLFDQFVSGIKAQFIGSVTSIVFLGFSVMLWPFIRRETSEHKKIC